jgi:hypothetical protein
MKRILFSIGIFALVCTASNAQDSRFPNRGCATMEEDARMRAEHPEMGTLEDFENWMEQKIQEAKKNPSASRVNTVYTIPVIVHVIHTGQAVGVGFNISDGQINSQIDVLNKDFRRLNTDTSLIPSIFKPAAADCEINFCMAKVNNTGVPLASPGIERINALTRGWTMSGLTNTYITNTIKPATIWNTNKYLNVWIVPDYTNAAGTPLLGFATFPTGSTLTGITGSSTSTTDGFVCWYQAFGNIGNLDPTYNKGRTSTHEIGHWLGLRHMWGDGTCLTDYCADTPPAQTANYGCKTHPFHLGTCSGNTTGEMFMNYMDYSDDDCLYMFTNDQKTRIQTAMANAPMRIAQANSTVCNPILTAGADASPVQITSPVATSCANSFVPAFTLVNFGNTPLTSCDLNYILDGGSVNTQPWTGSIASPGIALVTLPVINGSPNFSVGAHTLKIYTSNPNGVADANGGNDTVKVTFTITSPASTAISGTPFIQAFSTTPFTSATYPGWNLSNPNGGSPTWAYTNTAGGFGNSTSCLRVLNHSVTVPNPNAGQIDEFSTPNFDFSAANSYYLNFNVAYARRSSAINDSLMVYVSTDCDATWTRIYAKTSNVLSTNGGTSVTSSFTPTAAQWRSETINLAAYQGFSHVKFKFRNKNGGGNNIYVDDININNAPVGIATVISNQTKVSLYPNPSRGIFTLSTNFEIATNIQVNVIDVLGNYVYSTKKGLVKEEELNFDLSNLAKGFYFVEVKTERETITKRISIIE